MKKFCLGAFAAAVICGIVLAVSPGLRDELAWRWASHNDDTKHYASYLEAWPRGAHAPDAIRLYDERGWADAKGANTVASYENYLRLHPQGKYAGQAAEGIDDVHWAQAVKANSENSFKGYLDLHPAGRHAADANDRYDERGWADAKVVNAVAGYENYLRLHPQGKYAVQAAEGIDDVHWAQAVRAYTAKSLRRYLDSHPQGRHAGEAEAAIGVLETLSRQTARPLEGTVQTVDEATGTFRIRTAMGQSETLRISDDTQIHRQGSNQSAAGLTATEGVRIEYVNLPDGTLLATNIAVGYSVSHCSCGSACRCPLSRGCRAIRY